MFHPLESHLLSNFSKQRRWRPLLQLFGALLLVCLTLAPFSIPAFARAISPPSASTALSIPQEATPDGWKTVHYGTISLAVPAAWPVYDLSTDLKRCALLNVHAVYLGHQGPDALCPAHATGKSEVLQIEPLDATSASISRLATRAATIAGVPTRVDPSSAISHTIVVALTQANALISVSYGHTATLANQILGTLQIAGNGSRKPATQTSQPVQRLTSISPSGLFSGKGFDTCAAPSTGNMSAWLSDSGNPYRAVGIYISGVNRACGDGNLSSSWVSTVTGAGWSLLPLYVGLQDLCVNPAYHDATIDPNQAASQGKQAADDAANRAQNFGLSYGSEIFFDMEDYTRTTSCTQTALTFLDAWTRELHARNYFSGLYINLGVDGADLVSIAGNIQPPDAIDFAEWDGNATTSDPAIPGGDWAYHQRIKQYLGGHSEKHGGVSLNIDSDQFDDILSFGSCTGACLYQNWDPVYVGCSNSPPDGSHGVTWRGGYLTYHEVVITDQFDTAIARFRNVYSSACITNWAWGVLTGGSRLKLTVSTSGESTLCWPADCTSYSTSTSSIWTNMVNGTNVVSACATVTSPEDGRNYNACWSM